MGIFLHDPVNRLNGLGFFLQICELAMVLAVVFAQKIEVLV